jgi:hypothetical protein
VTNLLKISKLQDVFNISDSIDNALSDAGESSENNSSAENSS